jgi:hypothetical protein
MQTRIISFFKTNVSTLGLSDDNPLTIAVLDEITKLLNNAGILTAEQSLIRTVVSEAFDGDPECNECVGDTCNIDADLGGNGIHVFPTTRKKRKPKQKRKTKGGKKPGKNKTKKQRKNKKNTKTRRRK